ncbi:MAG: aminoacyl-tRNA hydrolase [Bogoriella megaspora]|nr:MAG: aminoacyl-tRNA hydrolase [Bogoriella megaspora]
MPSKTSKNCCTTECPPLEGVQMPLSPRPLLIASLGNPGSTYAHTLHSAGHTLIGAVAQQLGFTSFQKSPSLGKAPVSRPHPSSSTWPNGASDWTLWQSPSLMNISGRGLSQAFRAWQNGEGASESTKSDVAQLRKERGLLILLHDDLDLPLGQLKIRRGDSSARGQNGVKSAQGNMWGTPFHRIAIGIGRPVSRTSGDVSQWVLRKMTREERERVEGRAQECVELLKSLERK